MDTESRLREEFDSAALPLLEAVHGFARRLTRDEQDAADLVQESYLRAYRFFDRFEPGTNLKAWLFRIVKNTFINEYRRRKARPQTVFMEDVESAYEAKASELLGSGFEAPDRAVEATLLGEDIREAIDRLPDHSREVVVCCLVEGLTYEEAAQVLDVPVGTVMSRLHRARKALQGRLLVQFEERLAGRKAPEAC